MLNAGIITGNGILNANGGAGGSGYGAGGGGRVAVYNWNIMSLAVTNVTAAGGTGDNGPGQPGTVIFSGVPVFVWENDRQFLHGTESIAWNVLGVGQGELHVQLSASRAGTVYPIGTSTNSYGTLLWDTRTVPDGAYVLNAVYNDLSGQYSGLISRDVLVNNALVWHSGSITNSQTWQAGVVHVVDGKVFIGPGGNVTIQPGAILKFTLGSGISVKDGAILNALATPSLPIILTSFKDDTAGGDSNLDGDRSLPQPGDWAGISVATTGQFNHTSSVDFRYLMVVHGGDLAADEGWEGTFIHIIKSTVTVPSGVTLTIAPGAVLKFASGAGLSVSSGGRLNALGTLAQPITFTSTRDDSVGGDSNNDSHLTQPAPGDWVGLNIGAAVANLKYCNVRYGGNTGSGAFASGMFIVNSGKLALTGCLIETALYDGLSIYGTGGSATLTNCILRDLDRAIWAWGGGNVQLLNSTFDENVAALVQHGGATVTAENCIIANSVQGSVTEGPCTLSFCDLWSKYPNSSNPGVIGQNGNNSADPRFVNASQKDYRLRYGSPCIDAADSTLAPLADFMGAPRYTDPRAINRTGRPDAKGTYADLGPFEFVESASSAVDLVASDVSGPAQVGAGDTATLRWTVSNRGSGTATGPWHDAVYLIPLLGGSPVFVTEVLSGEGTALGTGQSLAVSARILAVGVPEGQYQWQIQANSRGDIFEGTNWTNNTALASSLTLLTVPQLVIGGPVANNQFTAAGQSLWYKFLPQTNSDVQVNLQATASAGSLEIYLGRGYIPTRDHFDSAGSLGGSSSASVIAPNASSQPYYVTVYAQAVPPSPLQFSISSSALAFSLTDAAPNVAGTGGSVTLKVSGGRLRDDMTFSLVGPGGTPHPSLSAWKAQDASVYATFDTTALPVGLYSLLVNDGASNRSLSNAVSLVAASPGAISYNVVMPSSIRWGQIRRAVLNYRNTGNTDVLAPVITINAINGTLVGVKMDTRSPVDFGNVLKQPSNTAQLLGINPAGPAGVLPPGFEGAFYFDVMANPGTYSVSLNVEEMLPARAMDWAGFKNSLKPLFLPADAWEAIYGNFTTRVGATTDQYRRLLSDDANYLSRLGHYTADVGLLLGFEIQKANAFGSIGLRYALGIFGRGFADPFNMTAQTDANGNVMVGCPSGFREFTRVSAGVYQAGPGDAAVLTDLPGGYRLEEADGVVTVFGSGGKINYIEQPNGWRVTLNYSGGRLAGISNSHGDALTYAYNGLGRVATITDPQGRVTTLAYDAAGEHLLSATDPAGTTQFTYLTGQGASREHAISAITFPDGRHLSLQYDSLGRISRQSGDQGANALNFAYDNQAGVTIADGAGGTFDYEFDDLQNLCTVRDPLGRRFTVAYDRQLTPKLLTDAEGNSQAMSFDGSGNLTSLVDWLGLNYTMTYSPANTLVGYANPAGVPLSFTFDQGRNLTGALYPDQTRLGFQRDQLGQLTAWSNRRGQTMRYNLNASGQLANKQFSSGPQENFTYDNHRNLVKIIDAKGTNTYTFDGADRLTGVHYPSGRSLTYAYDAYGRRTQLLADDGYTVKYNYDAGGRLSSLLDKNNALIVSYSYDAAGRLTREDKGNQTYTTYAYDLAGQVLHLINHRKDNSVLSRFDYTYDLVGRPATVATLEGTWEYQYDANGQLTTAVFASTNSGVPGQTNAFVYDSAGNRTQALVNGTATSYLADRMDRYLAVGAARYSYDADGNLTSITDETGVTSFTYDELNRLTSVTSPTDTWSYEYDAFNFRRASVHNGVRTEYLIDPLCQGAVVGDYVNGALSGHYAQGIGLVGRTESDGTARYYNFDIIGNTTEFTGPNGAVLNSYRYRPFGDLISSQETAPNRFSYGGRWGVATESSGLSLMGARYYRPVEGRFLTEEPVGRRYPNAYAYAYNTPVLYNDPTGLDGQNGFLNWLIGFIPFSSTFTGMQATWTAGQQGHAEYQSNIDALSSNPNAPLHGDSVNGGQVGGMYLPALQQAGGTVLNSQMNVVNQSFSSVQGAPAATSPLGITQTGIGTGLNAMKDHYMNKKPGRKIGGGDGKTNPPGKPPGPPNGNSANGLSNSGGSTDPNDLIGPIGFGDGRWVPAGSPMLYTIDFENLPTVLLPAQSVDIENQLDPHLDWSTFELQQIGFNRVTINVLPGLKSFTTSAVVATDPNPVSVVVSFNPLTGMLKSHLESTDPVTGLLVEDPLAGFLPPNDAQHRGEGFLSYTIRTASALSSDSQVHNQASIVFDVNAPLRTPTATNSIDVSLPSSGVAALPAISTNVQFRVSWSGFDLGSGIAAYNVFVSVDNGPWSAWRISTPKSSELYTGQPGRTYSFYSIVEDNVGHSELKLPHAEATTLVSTNASQAIQPVLLGGLNTNGLFQINFTGSPNLTNYVEISTNLLNWTQLAPLYNTSGSFEFEDTTSKNVQTRFYRVRVQGP